MGKSLKEILYENFDISINKKNYLDVKKYVNEFEMRSTHMLALNTSLLGAYKIYFVTKDNNNLFNIFNIDINSFKEIVQSADNIDTDRLVTSDPYNIFVLWLAHQIRKSSLSVRDKEDMQFLLFKMLHYKFFTSVVNHNLRYGADEEIMFYTIDELSGKFYIKHSDTPTWRLVMEARSKDIINPKSIHNNTITNFHPDEKILYVITDIQTRIRKQLVTIIMRFHENKKAGNRISSGSMSSEIDGKKVLKVITSDVDSMIGRITNSVLNTNEFLDESMIKTSVVLTKNITTDLLTNLLISFSDVATVQQKHGDQELIEGTGNKQIIKGYKLLISNIIQKTYRQCMLDNNLDLGSRVQILSKTRNLYRSSRISNKDILLIKTSVEKLVEELSNSRRSSTNASLKIAFILYIILLSFKEM
jgi:hypothetical protein